MASVKGVDKVRRSLQNLEKQTEGGVFRALESTIMEMEDKATAWAPHDMGKLRQAFSHAVNKLELTATLSNSAPHAIWVEVGTGTYVKIPAELREAIAKMQIKKSGTFSEFLKAIEGWCKRKGIDEKAAYPIAISILRKGIKPQPFMYPALVWGRKEFTKKIRDLIKGLKG